MTRYPQVDCEYFFDSHYFELHAKHETAKRTTLKPIPLQQLETAHWECGKLLPHY